MAGRPRPATRQHTIPYIVWPDEDRVFLSLSILETASKLCFESTLYSYLSDPGFFISFSGTFTYATFSLPCHLLSFPLCLYSIRPTTDLSICPFVISVKRVPTNRKLRSIWELPSAFIDDTQSYSYAVECGLPRVPRAHTKFWKIYVNHPPEKCLSLLIHFFILCSDHERKE